MPLDDSDGAVLWSCQNWLMMMMCNGCMTSAVRFGWEMIAPPMTCPPLRLWDDGASDVCALTCPPLRLWDDGASDVCALMGAVLVPGALPGVLCPQCLLPWGLGLLVDGKSAD